MSRVIFIIVTVILWQGCCAPYCSMVPFAQNANRLFGAQIRDGWRDTPSSARFVGQMLKGDTSSFVRTGAYVVEVGKGDARSARTVGRVIREQWEESLENIPKNAKTIGLYTCLYCDKKK